ncbi:MAG: glycosyltransferase family 39 protein [Caldilinea sp.]|nr:glycosyltransferase family 39 protein [Caldilinea sp.]MDW8441837.1 glycosyltransferase family 39 protein [Caldilineaceae bacterium]
MQRLFDKTSPLGATIWLRLFLFTLLFGAFTLRLQELTRQDIWWDEARNIDVALRPLFQIANAPELDIQPPLYYWLLHGWSNFFGVAKGQPPTQIAFFSRLLSTFIGVVGVALLMAYGRRVGGVKIGAPAALIGALSPFWLAESQETRMYTLGFALLTAAAALFLDQLAFRRRNDAPLFSGTSLLFVLFATAALMTHYNVVFVLVAWWITWGVWAMAQSDRWRQLKAVFAHGLAMTLLFLPIAPIALRQIPDYQNPNITVVTLSEYLRQNWQAYLGGYAYDPTLLMGFADFWLWGIALAAALGLVLGRIAMTHTTRRTSAPAIHSFALPFTLAWLIGGLALYYLAVLDRSAFHVRYAGFVTPALYTLIAVGLAGFARWWRPAPALLALTLAVGLAHGAHADLYDTRFDREHIAALTQWLRETTTPDDVIFVDQKYPFGFYYQPYAIDAEETLSASEVAPARYLFVDINTIDRRLTEWAGHAQRVFWVQWFESDTDPRRAVPFLLDKYGRRAGEQWFHGYAVDWWELTPPTRFELAPQMQPLTLQFEHAVQTVQASLPSTPLCPGDPLPVVLRWRRVPGGAAARPLKARVALYDAADNRLAQADERLLNDRHLAPAYWSIEDRPLGVYLLAAPDDLASGQYALRLLVYDAENLNPLPWIDEAGNPAGIEPELATLEMATGEICERKVQ